MKWCDDNSALVDELFKDLETEGITVSVDDNTVTYTIDLSNYLEDKKATYSEEELEIIVGQKFDLVYIEKTFAPVTEALGRLSGISNINTDVLAKYNDKVITRWRMIND